MATVNEIRKRLEKAEEELEEFKNEGKAMRLKKLKMGEVKEGYIKEKEELEIEKKKLEENKKLLEENKKKLEEDKKIWQAQVIKLGDLLFRNSKGNKQIT